MTKFRTNTLVVLAVILALISIVTACTSSSTTAPTSTTPTETTTAPPASSSPSISSSPSASATAAPSASATAAPSSSATAAPSASAAAAPSSSATAAPTSSATAVPTSSATAAPTASSAGAPVTVDLVAQNIAFDKKTITVPAGAKVTVNFNNKDSGISHNLAVYTDSSATTAIFVGNIITGPSTTTYTFTAPTTPGTYFFRCDVHPTQMTGQFIVQ